MILIVWKSRFDDTKQRDQHSYELQSFCVRLNRRKHSIYHLNVLIFGIIMGTGVDIHKDDQILDSFKPGKCVRFSVSDSKFPGKNVEETGLTSISLSQDYLIWKINRV